MKMILAGIVCLFLLSACDHTASAKLGAGAHYVNMGSSFAAGADITPPRPLIPERCGQSEANYASLLATKLQISLEDRSCGGATSSHLLESWNDLPPQIDAITSETKLVTITVGGNDLGYVRNLFAASCDEAKGFVLQGKKIPCVAEQQPTQADYTRLQSNMREIAKQIAIRAPEATTVFVQYLTLVPETLCDKTGLTEEKAARSRLIAERLSEITTAAAEENGAEVLRVDKLSRDHTACDADPWSMASPQQDDILNGTAWHPNRRGHEAIAELLRSMLSQ